MSYRTLYTAPTPLRQAARQAADWGLITAEERDEMLAALRGCPNRKEFVSAASQYSEFTRCARSARVMDTAMFLGNENADPEEFWSRYDRSGRLE